MASRDARATGAKSRYILSLRMASYDISRSWNFFSNPAFWCIRSKCVQQRWHCANLARDIQADSNDQWPCHNSHGARGKFVPVPLLAVVAVSMMTPDYAKLVSSQPHRRCSKTWELPMQRWSWWGGCGCRHGCVDSAHFFVLLWLCNITSRHFKTITATNQVQPDSTAENLVKYLMDAMSRNNTPEPNAGLKTALKYARFKTMQHASSQHIPWIRTNT